MRDFSWQDAYCLDAVLKQHPVFVNEGGFNGGQEGYCRGILTTWSHFFR
jgi:hypothetical protein